MVKSIVSIICVLTMIVSAALFEHFFITKQFDDLHGEFATLYEKIEGESAVKEDVLSVQNSWLAKKKYLHIFIPHNEIKEIDLWLAESVTLVDEKKWEDALSKAEVLMELAEQIPQTFRLTPENIF